MPRKVVIFGATSAIAAEIARVYSHQGDDLFIVGRSPEKLEALRSGLSLSVRGSMICDLDDLDAASHRARAAIDALGGLDIAIIAHGLLGDQIRSERDLSHALEIIRTNYLSAVSLLIPLANYFESEGRGRLAAITSVAGERGRPRNYTYGSSKGALTRYLQGLHSRLYRSGVKVHNIKLGPVDTPMSAGHPKHALFGQKDKVAQGILRALEGNKHVVYLPWFWRWIMVLVRLLPEPIFQRFDFLAGR